MSHVLKRGGVIVGIALVAATSIVAAACGSTYGDGTPDPLSETGAAGDATLEAAPFDASDAGSDTGSLDASDACAPGEVRTQLRVPRKLESLQQMTCRNAACTIGVAQQPWANVDAAAVSDDVYASAAVDPLFGGEYATHFLYASDFGFDVPTGATLQGIRFSIERKASSPGLVQMRAFLVEKGLVENTVPLGGLVLTTVDQPEVLGGPTETWNLPWLDRAAVVDKGLGIAFFMQRSSDAGAITAFVDAIEATVFYACP